MTSPDGQSLLARKIATGLVFVCGVALFFDIGGELHAALVFPTHFSALAWFHLAMELAASLGLGVAFVLLRREMRQAISAKEDETHKLRQLRSEFDNFLHTRFEIWGLSPAETDIALLTIRGLKISEIAELRDTREGTVKSQLSSIFRKSGMTNRTAFVAQFIDEFLEISATDVG